MEKGKTYPTEVLTHDEVMGLIGQCSRRAPTGIRNAALIALIWRAGLRISEALALKPSDIDLDTGRVDVLRGKGHKRRVVAMDAIAKPYVLRWMDTRNGLRINGHSPLFTTLKGKPIQSRYVRALLPRLAEKAGIEKRVHPHGLRHSRASEMAETGVPVNLIQKALGHSHLSTTAIYLDHISATDVVDAMSTGWSVEDSRE